MSLRDGLRDLAEQAPTAPVPPGLFDRARQRDRRRRTAAVTAVVLIALAGYGVGLPTQRVEPFAAGSAGIPGRVLDPPAWTEEVAKAPAGPAAVVFRGPAVPERFTRRDSISPTALVGLNADTYRVVYPSEGTLALSPDGHTLLVPHLEPNSDGLRARSFRTDALDLVFGTTRPLVSEFVPVGWSTDGKRALLVQRHRWDRPDAPAETVNDITVRVVDWPSGQPEWSVHVARPDAIEGESTFPLALSPDGSMLAVSTSRELRVYHRDGTLRWRSALSGYDTLAGPAAWRDDGRLAVMRRSPTPAQNGPWGQPTEWTLAYVDAASGAPVADPRLPTVPGAVEARVTAWRGDTAYAVVLRQAPDHPADTRASLVRLLPGESTPETILASDGASDLNVATDHIDSTRYAGSPSYGLSLTGLLSIPLDYSGRLLILAIVVVVVWRARRRKRVRRSAAPSAP